MVGLKVLHVIAGMNPISGGVCQAVKSIIKALAPIGFVNEIVSLDNRDASYLKENNLCIHAMGEGRGPWKYNRNLQGWLRVNLYRFDIVIVHGLWLYSGFAARREIDFLKRKKLQAPKFLVMPHGMLDPYFQKAEGRKIKALRNFIFWKLIENKMISRADGLLFTCERERSLAAGSFFPYSPKVSSVVGLVVEAPPLYTPQMQQAFGLASGIINKKPYLLFLGRIEKKKGLDILLKAYIQLCNKNSALPALVIAGPGLSTLYGQKIKQLANNQPAIHFTGMLTGDAKWGAYYGCEAFVLASHQENFGITIVEAMACKKTVLISNQVNIYKEIEQAGAGLICSDNFNGIETMLANWSMFSSKKKQEKAEAAGRCFNEIFGMDTFSQRFLHLVQTL